jgi:hypothetical protein
MAAAVTLIIITSLPVLPPRGRWCPVTCVPLRIQAGLAPRLYSQRTIALTQLGWQEAIFELLLGCLSESRVV